MAASENIITWNVPNWVTVVLMVVIGFMVLGVLAQLAHNVAGTGSGPLAAAMS